MNNTEIITTLSISLGLLVGACDTEPAQPRGEASAMAEAEGGAAMVVGLGRDEEGADAPAVEAIERALAAGLEPQASGSAVAVLTQQIVPNSQNDPAIIELVTLTNNPHILSADAQGVTVPNGLGVLSFAETVSARICPVGGTCKQRWILNLDITEVCELDGSYDVDFSVGCALGSDCSSMDPNFTDFNVPFVLNSENFCGEIDVEVCPVYDVDTSEPDFCSEECPCEHGQGDCDSDKECAAGLECTHNVGGYFGLPPLWDVCLPS